MTPISRGQRPNQSHRHGTGLPSRHAVASSRNTDIRGGMLAFWVAEFGGQDRLAPAFWDMVGHVAIWPTQHFATLRLALSPLEDPQP